MSTFLGWQSALVTAGTTTSANQTLFANLLTSTYTWQLARQANLMTSYGGTFTSNIASAFDMSGTTSASTTTLPAYIYANASGGFTPVNMYIQADNTNGGIAPLSFTLDYATSSGGPWTTLQSFVQLNWHVGERRKVTITGATAQTFWRINVISCSNGGSTVGISEFTLEDASNNWLVNNNFFDIYPPTTETVGNSIARDTLRWSFPSANTSISMLAIQDLFTAQPQMISLDTATAGAVTSTIGLTNTIANTVAASTGGMATFATNVMTLTTAPTVGYISLGSVLSSGSGIPTGTTIVNLLSGTINAVGSTYQLSTTPGTISTPVSITTCNGSSGGTITSTGTVLTLVTAPTVGAITLGQQIYTGGSVVVYLMSLASGTLGAAGSTYNINSTIGTISTAQAVISQITPTCTGMAVTFSGTTMTCTTANSVGLFTLGQTITGVGLPLGLTVISVNSGNMGTVGSTYTVSATSVGTALAIIYNNGNVAQYTGISANTALQNARGLYEVCKNSTNPAFLQYYWVWQGNYVNIVGSNIFHAVQKTAYNNQAITGANIVAHYRTTSVATPIAQGGQFGTPSTITIDAINGWIYYLQVNSRGIALATKTNANYYTPIHACYGDNASAVAQVPPSDFSAYGLTTCTPIELFVGTDGAVTVPQASAYTSHFWGAAAVWSAVTTGMSYYLGVDTSGTSVANFSHFASAGYIQDVAQCLASGANSTSTASATLVGEGLFNNASAGYGASVFNVHKLSAVSNIWTPVYIFAVSLSGTTTIPSYNTFDWYKFVGTAPTNEQLLISPLTDFTTTIASGGPYYATDTTITVLSTTGFPASGWIILDGEIISYSGLTSTSFTGCVRGKYVTTAYDPVPGATVYIAGWFCFIVSGLVFGGYQQPT